MQVKYASRQVLYPSPIEAAVGAIVARAEVIDSVVADGVERTERTLPITLRLAVRAFCTELRVETGWVADLAVRVSAD